MLDRLRHLRGDRQQQADLALREVAPVDRADVERAFELVAREDRHGEDRLEPILREVRERLEARIEVRLRRKHHRHTLRAATPVIPSPSRMRGRFVISSTRVPNVARSTSSVLRSS